MLISDYNITVHDYAMIMYDCNMIIRDYNITIHDCNKIVYD